MIGSNDECDDILQDVFIKCFTNIKSFDIKQRFSPWIYRIAHNETINKLRKKRGIPFSQLDTPEYDFGGNLPSTLDTHKEVSEGYDHVQVRKIIAQLPSAHREVLVLYFYDELSYAEISDVLRIPISSVGVKISRAKELLAKHLKHLYE
jgi:RNA polymerase sigma-70 factor (ECF subfamily)